MALPRLNSPFLLFYPAIERHVSQTGLAAEPAQAKTRFEILLNPLFALETLITEKINFWDTHDHPKRPILDPRS